MVDWPLAAPQSLLSLKKVFMLKFESVLKTFFLQELLSTKYHPVCLSPISTKTIGPNAILLFFFIRQRNRGHQILYPQDRGQF